jgi:hypothetical protein
LSKPELPKLVICEISQTRGLDLLGLRISAENRALKMLDGVTTITPLVRYLGLRCWLIKQYSKVGGMKNWDDFIAFACKIESAIILGNCLTDENISGRVGSTKAKEIIQIEKGSLPLTRLTKIIATNMYAGPSHDLGLSSSSDGYTSITSERGDPLANALGKSLDNLEALTSITPNADPQKIPVAQLAEVGSHFRFGSIPKEELELYIRFIIPEEPRESELPRLGTYITLLELAKSLKRKPKEDDFFAAATDCNLESFSPILETVLDGWAHFIVRDMLVCVHESAVAIIGESLQKYPGCKANKTQLLDDILTEEIIEVYERIGLEKLDLKSPVCELVKSFKKALGTTTSTNSPSRWSGKLNEMMLLDDLKANSIKGVPNSSLVALLPVSWLLGVERITEDSIRAEDDEVIDESTRIGIREVVYPVVAEWEDSKETIRSVLSKLILRSIDQHLRIAWSRLAREPRKDVSVLHKDGDEFVYAKNLYPGRATSRVGEAINWLNQLAMINKNGITEDGERILEHRLKVFANNGGLN